MSSRNRHFGGPESCRLFGRRRESFHVRPYHVCPTSFDVSETPLTLSQEKVAQYILVERCHAGLGLIRRRFHGFGVFRDTGLEEFRGMTIPFLHAHATLWKSERYFRFESERKVFENNSFF